MRFILLLVLLGTACSDLREIDEGRCGNGIVELGEDCDSSSDPRCVACGIRCEADRTCAYPGAEGFVCGADDFCRAPSGMFRPATALSLAVESFGVTDIDEDHFGDLLIQSPTSLQVVYGNAAGVPNEATTTLTPIVRGAAYFTDLDVDGKTDVMLPSTDGIVAYTSPYQVLSPFPFPSVIDNDEGIPYYSHPIDDGVIGFIGTTKSDPRLLYFARDVSMSVMGPPPATPVCGGVASEFSAYDVDTYHVRQGLVMIVVALRPASGPARLCVIVAEKVGNTYQLSSPAAPAAQPSSRPLLAPVRGGPCPSMIVRDGLRVWEYPGIGVGPCTFGAREALDGLGGNAPIAAAPLSPPGPNGEVSAIVTTAGVFAYGAGATLTQLYVADRPLLNAALADVDDDGDSDFVATASVFGGREPVEDIDILYRHPAGFLRYRYDTEGPVTTFLVGDFDGNAIPDVAFVQAKIQAGRPNHELVLAYGTRDQLSAPTSSGTYGRVITLMVGDIPDANDPLNAVSDIVVLYEHEGTAKVTLLHGSPQRTMIGFYDPRPNDLSTPSYRAALAGNFNDASGPSGKDIIAFDDEPHASGAAKLWLSNGPTGGDVVAQEPFHLTEVTDCTTASVPGDEMKMCMAGSRYLAWPTGDNTDRVIGVGLMRDGRPTGVTFDLRSDAYEDGSGAQHVNVTRWTPAAPERAIVRALEVLQLGGGPRLLVTFAPPGSQDGEARAVHLCDVTAGMPTCTDLGITLSHVVGEELACYSATTGSVTAFGRFQPPPSGGKDLIVLCKGAGLSLYKVAIDGNSPVTAERLLDLVSAHEVRTGDFNGDGLDDLITVDRSTGIPTMRIHTQCTSRDRDVGCTRAGQLEGMTPDMTGGMP